jgi:hypothetical protein
MKIWQNAVVLGNFLTTAFEDRFGDLFVNRTMDSLNVTTRINNMVNNNLNNTSAVNQNLTNSINLTTNPMNLTTNPMNLTMNQNPFNSTPPPSYPSTPISSYVPAASDCAVFNDFQKWREGLPTTTPGPDKFDIDQGYWVDGEFWWAGRLSYLFLLNN